MSSLRDEAGAIRASRFPALQLRAIPLTVIAAEQIKSVGFHSESPRAGKNYDEIAMQLLSKIDRGVELTELDVRDGPWCLWTTTPKLAGSPAALKAVLTGVERNNKKRTFRSLASSYVASFAPDIIGVDEAGSVLARMAPNHGRPWAILQSNYRVFHKVDGPQEIAQASITGRTSPTEILKHAGLGGVDSQSGFAKACAAIALERLAAGVVNEPLARLQLVRTLSINARGRLLFEDHAPRVADALLRPFGDSLPDPSVRDQYLSPLLALFDDPRLRPGRWARMPAAMAIVHRWLTEQSLRQFLSVVDTVAKVSMWKYRRAFWEAVYEKNLISEAWVVFDSHGVAAARRAFGKEVKFGEFAGRGQKPIEKGHSVLLLRIGRGVVADWSHNGKCNIWNDAETSDAPKLYRPTYTSDDVIPQTNTTSSLDGPVFSTPHSGADGYNWQSRVADKIYQMTRVRVPQTSYQVR